MPLDVTKNEWDAAFRLITKPYVREVSAALGEYERLRTPQTVNTVWDALNTCLLMLTQHSVVVSAAAQAKAGQLLASVQRLRAVAAAPRQAQAQVTTPTATTPTATTPQQPVAPPPRVAPRQAVRQQVQPTATTTTTTTTASAATGRTAVTGTTTATTTAAPRPPAPPRRPPPLILPPPNNSAAARQTTTTTTTTATSTTAATTTGTTAATTTTVARTPAKPAAKPAATTTAAEDQDRNLTDEEGKKKYGVVKWNNLKVRWAQQKDQKPVLAADKAPPVIDATRRLAEAEADCGDTSWIPAIAGRVMSEKDHSDGVEAKHKAGSLINPFLTAHNIVNDWKRKAEDPLMVKARAYNTNIGNVLAKYTLLDYRDIRHWYVKGGILARNPSMPICCDGCTALAFYTLYKDSTFKAALGVMLQHEGTGIHEQSGRKHWYLVAAANKADLEPKNDTLNPNCFCINLWGAAPDVSNWQTCITTRACIGMTGGYMTLFCWA